MGERVLREVQGVLRVLDLPPGWVVQDPTAYRSLGGGQGSFVMAVVGLDIAYWGYRLPARQGWLSLATHVTINLHEVGASPVPRVWLDIALEKPCEAKTITLNDRQLSMVSESNIRPGDSCDCATTLRVESGR